MKKKKILMEKSQARWILEVQWKQDHLIVHLIHLEKITNPEIEEIAVS